MNTPKTFITLLIGIVLAINIKAQDTTKRVFTRADIEPSFPGGIPAFHDYIQNNLQYPMVARLLGLTGKVYLSFIVEKDGSISNVKPIKCLGAGCESEAVRVISMSPKWQPGQLHGMPVRVMYTVPINFSFTNTADKTFMESLRNSDYGFAFFIKGRTYSLDEAQQILGESFDPAAIASVENLCDTQYTVSGKTWSYLVVIKDVIPTQDTNQVKQPFFTKTDTEPSFPGGTPALRNYIQSNLRYPPVAQLLGLRGKVSVSFIVGEDGYITDVKPLNSLGAGCEAEAVRVFSLSPKWQPGIKDGHPVKVNYTIPLNFDLANNNGKTYMVNLRNSDYGFAFLIKGQIYSLNDAQKILGDSFDPTTIKQIIDGFNDPKFVAFDKKATYLVVMKNSDPNQDTTTVKPHVLIAVEYEPSFPGGTEAFYMFINHNLHYPEVAELLGINGKVIVNFTVDKTGKLVDITSQKSLGAGCEYEAAKVVSMCPKWRPGLQNGHPVKVHYAAEVSFTKTKRRITFKELKESPYGFVFQLRDTLYTIDEAEAQLGDSFKQNKLQGTELFYNPDNIPKLSIADKKEVYLLRIKS